MTVIQMVRMQGFSFNLIVLFCCFLHIVCSGSSFDEILFVRCRSLFEFLVVNIISLYFEML